MQYLTNIDLNKNQLINAVIQPLATAPSNPAMAQIYYDTTDKVMYQYNGTDWVAVGESVTYELELGTVASNAVPINLVCSDGTTDTVYIKGTGGAVITKDGESIVIEAGGAGTTYTFSGAMSGDNFVITITPSAGDAQTITVPLSNYVKNTLKINGKALTGDITLTTNDIESSGGKTIDALLAEKVDKTLTVNGKALSSNVTLGASDINTAGGDSVEAVLQEKVDKEAGKGLSTNDYNNTEKALVAGALQTTDLATATGTSTVTAMTQKAVTDALNLKVDVEAGKGLSTNDFTNAYKALVDGAVQKDGTVAMEANFSLGTHKITNLGNGTADADAVNYKQLQDAIAALGTVFDLKGTKATVGDLPASGNTAGDVWYVTAESRGYVWISNGTTNVWEPFAPAMDLSGYLEIADLATATGAGTTTAMTQKATTDALALKLDKTDATPIAFEDITMSGTSANIDVDGDIVAITVKDSSTGEVVIADITHTGDGTATVIVATTPVNPLSIRVLYMEEV